MAEDDSQSGLGEYSPSELEELIKKRTQK